MPWYNQSGSTSRQSSCLETCKTIRQFSEDLSGVKSLLQIAYNLPEGIPSTQWDQIIRGESINLNQLLSSMHCYDFERFRLFAAVILASHLRSSSFETKECLCCQRYCLKFVELVQVFIKD